MLLAQCRLESNLIFFVAAVVVDDLAPGSLECHHVVVIVASGCPYSY